MEPSPKTREEVGRLCAAWSYLEWTTEHTLWGISPTHQNANLDLEGSWKVILKAAPSALDPNDLKDLQQIYQDILTVKRDRNIIVHGRIGALMVLPKRPPTYTVVGPSDAGYEFARVACWTLYKGPEAGKNFPISPNAVEIVRSNIQSIATHVQDFNKRLNFLKGRPITEIVEASWPTSI
jgi:hypothetical protein